MHEHDEIVIFDLVADASVDEGVAALRLDGCSRCLADLREQRAMAGLLGSLDPPVLSEIERRAIRRHVEAELPRPRMRPARRWSPNWAALGGVAAALVAFVVVGGILPSGEDDAATGDDLTLAVETDTAEEAGAVAGADIDPADRAAAADSAEQALAPLSQLVFAYGELDAAELPALIEDVSEQAVSVTETSGLLRSELAPIECVGELDESFQIRALLTATVDGEAIEVYFDDAGEPSGFAGRDCSPYALP